jgi:argininosuccinate lyase
MDNRIFALGEVPRTLEKAAETVELMAGVIAGLEFDTELMQARAGRGFTWAMDLAETIMQQGGVPYRSAHRVVGLAIRSTLDRDPAAQTIPPDVLAAAAREVLGHELELSRDTMARLEDPAAVVATRTGLGGAAAEPVGAMLADCRARFASFARWQGRTAARLAAAERRLVAHARKRTTVARTPRH